MPKKPNDMFQMERKEDAIGVGDGADFIGELSPKSKKRGGGRWTK
jgi:hypothetical protein